MSNLTSLLSPEYIHASRGHVSTTTAIVFIPAILIFVSLRFYSRYLSKTKCGADDYLVLAALVLEIIHSAIAICVVKYGNEGRHLDALEQTDPRGVTTYYKWLLVVSSYYFAVVGIPKLAILALYHRVFPIKFYHNIIYVLIFIVIATGIVCPIMSLNLCHPFAFNWNHSIPGGKCLNGGAFYRWGSLPNILTDIALLVLPMPIVWNMKASTNMKIGLTLTFLTGSIGLATSIIRFQRFWIENAVTSSWASVDLEVWTLIEPNVYLIAACLPAYRPLIVRIISKTRWAKGSILVPVHDSAKMAKPAHKAGSGESAKDKRSFRGFRKMGKNGLESLGNTFDMQDTFDMGDVKSPGASDHVQVPLGESQSKNDISVITLIEIGVVP